ncbi:MAG: hypothetical protein HY078_14830 [Elusimicrobia bacterium]|nr:hypothetical protein [Elusimicrobiota bacterium]
MRDLAGCLGSDDNTLLTLACKSTAGNFLYGHCVNVTILSLHACLGMNPSGEGLTALGAAAFLHDLDDDAVANASDEAREAATHALSGGELKSHFREIQRVERDVRAAILPGEPDDHRETMSRFAQILCVCDIYEANTHPRDWRTPLIPHDALKKLIRGSLPGIEDRIVKFFLERMSLFPPGSFVQLSSGEIAAVVGVHAELPTRPILEIRVRSDGQKEAPGVRLDLGEHPVLHVAKAIDETAVPMRDAKLQLQFQANRWWTD